MPEGCGSDMASSGSGWIPSFPGIVMSEMEGSSHLIHTRGPFKMLQQPICAFWVKGYLSPKVLSHRLPLIIVWLFFNSCVHGVPLVSDRAGKEPASRKQLERRSWIAWFCKRPIKLSIRAMLACVSFCILWTMRLAEHILSPDCWKSSNDWRAHLSVSSSSPSTARENRLALIIRNHCRTKWLLVQFCSVFVWYSICPKEAGLISIVDYQKCCRDFKLGKPARVQEGRRRMEGRHSQHERRWTESWGRPVSSKTNMVVRALYLLEIIGCLEMKLSPCL